ncbi:phage prohead protease, HK97 family [Sphingopyxis flava]|uniref:Phage prohead protease, HK97 family n=2 Tax=Sphingopyxis flava TaxID=1507287 RepID=A0A1T4ZWJ4_9SPHN|nr:phage prohead protease, HK97 family [Sphingopyxis flava]
MQNRAYSVLQVKAFDDDTRKFSGIATTPTVDRMGDIIDPLGVKFKNPLPLLHQHFHDRPVGTVKFKKPTKDGIEFEAEIAKIEEDGPLKDRCDTAWGELKYGLVRATSVGFRPIEYSFMDNGGIRFSEVEVYELSTVTIPAQPDAVIFDTIKSLDAAARKAAGVPDPEIPQPDEPAPQSKKARVVKLDEPAEGSVAPFVVREIKRT